MSSVLKGHSDPTVRNQLQGYMPGYMRIQLSVGTELARSAFLNNFKASCSDV